MPRPDLKRRWKDVGQAYLLHGIAPKNRQQKVIAAAKPISLTSVSIGHGACRQRARARAVAISG
jgi:hypothetical protein